MSEPVVVRLFLAYECKHSIRYNAPTEDAKKVVTSMYLMKDAYELIGKPKGIEVTVKALE